MRAYPGPCPFSPGRARYRRAVKQLQNIASQPYVVERSEVLEDEADLVSPVLRLTPIAMLKG